VVVGCSQSTLSGVGTRWELHFLAIALKTPVSDSMSIMGFNANNRKSMGMVSVRKSGSIKVPLLSVPSLSVYFVRGFASWTQ
jgi:hypothetical protein